RWVRALPLAGGRPWPNGGGRTSTVPPAEVIADSADFENAWALTCTERVSSPRPRTLTRPCLWTRPLARSASGVTSSPSKFWRVSRLTTAYSTRKGFLNPLSLGTRRASGIWPPSNPTGTVPRAFWPFMPRPAVLPPLPAMPRPTRRRGLVDPFGGFRSWIFIGRRLRRLPSEEGMLAHWFARFARSRGLDLLHIDQVRDPGDHSPDLRAVGQHVALTDAPEPEGAQRPAVLRLRSDPRAHLGHLEIGHQPPSEAAAGAVFRSRSVS